MVTTTAFEAFARQAAHTLGMANLPLLVIEHPLGSEPAERVAAKAEHAVMQLRDATESLGKP